MIGTEREKKTLLYSMTVNDIARKKTKKKNIESHPKKYNLSQQTSRVNFTEEKKKYVS